MLSWVLLVLFMVLCSGEAAVYKWHCVCVYLCVCNVYVWVCDVWECGCACLFVCDEDQRDGRTELVFCHDDCLLLLRLTFQQYFDDIVYVCYGSHVDCMASLPSPSPSLSLPLPLPNHSMGWPRCFRVSRVWSSLSVPWIPITRTWWLTFSE